MRKTTRADTPLPSLADLRCGCGSAAIMALRPGQDAVRRGAVDLFTRLDPLLVADVPDVAWCDGCWGRGLGLARRRRDA